MKLADVIMLTLLGIVLWGSFAFFGSAIMYVFGRWCARLLGWA